MKKSDAIAYLNRWEEVENVEKREAQTTTIQERWIQLNSLFGLALELDLFEKSNDTEEDMVWQRWAALRG